MKVTEKDIEVEFIKMKPKKITKHIIIYTCSDGKEFSTENDYGLSFPKAKTLAEEHEAILKKENELKIEFKVFLIEDNRNSNCGFIKKFCFYLDNMSDNIELRNKLSKLICNLGDYLNSLKEGWCLVEQEVESDYDDYKKSYKVNGYFGLLTEYIENIKGDLLYHENLLKTLTKK